MIYAIDDDENDDGGGDDDDDAVAVRTRVDFIIA